MARPSDLEIFKPVFSFLSFYHDLLFFAASLHIFFCRRVSLILHHGHVPGSNCWTFFLALFLYLFQTLTLINISLLMTQNANMPPEPCPRTMDFSIYTSLCDHHCSVCLAPQLLSLPKPITKVDMTPSWVLCRVVISLSPNKNPIAWKFM